MIRRGCDIRAEDVLAYMEYLNTNYDTHIKNMKLLYGVPQECNIIVPPAGRIRVFILLRKCTTDTLERLSEPTCVTWY